VIARQRIDFERMTLLVGLHGAGKTYLLNVLNELLPGWQVSSSTPPAGYDFRDEFVGSFEMRLGSNGASSDVRLPLPRIEQVPQYAAPVADLDVTMVSGFSAVSELAMAAQEYPLRHEGSATFSALDAAGTEAMGRILGHRYTDIQVADYDYDRMFFPLIKGLRDDVPFTTWTLSGGEFWVVYLLWILRGASDKEVVLIDEPESYLAAPAHLPLAEEVARLAEKTQCQVVMATHSSSIIASMPPTMLRLVSSAPEGTRADRVSSGEAVLRALGRGPLPVTTIVYVEDALAGRIVREALIRFSGSEHGRFDVIASGGASEALGAARVTRRSPRLAACAVLDGDERTKGRPPGTLFLPGEGTPEHEMLLAVENAADEFARIIGAAPAEVRTSVQAAQSIDHQRAFARMAGVLGLDEERLLTKLIDWWLTTVGVRSEAEFLAAELARTAPSRH